MIAGTGWKMVEAWEALAPEGSIGTGRAMQDKDENKMRCRPIGRWIFARGTCVVSAADLIALGTGSQAFRAEAMILPEKATVETWLSKVSDRASACSGQCQENTFAATRTHLISKVNVEHFPPRKQEKEKDPELCT